MRFLLFLVSLIFSFIFYSFYLLSSWKSFFWENINYEYYFDSLSWNLLIESIVFLFFWVVFLFSFTSYKTNDLNNKINYNVILYIFYYLFLILPIYFNIFYFNFTLFSILIFFIFWDIVFKFISNLIIFKDQKINLRYFWLILNYLSFISSFFYLFIIDFSYYIFLIIAYSILFNFYIHKKYTNYISLLLSIFGALFFLYFLFLKIKEIYILLF